MAFVWARWAPDYVGTDGQGGGRQIPRARCAWMCFHVSRKCLTLGPLLTSKIGCQRHFLECPVKINMWTETTGLQSPEWWARGPSWHLCPTTPFASYANAKLYKIKGLIYLRLLRRLRRKKILQHQFVGTVCVQEIRKVVLTFQHHCQLNALSFCFTLC